MSEASAQALVRLINDTCTRAWKPQSYSRRDTQETQDEARANNAAREAYCRGKPKQE